MRNFFSFAGAVALAVMLVACSGGREKPKPSYEELEPPAARCLRARPA
ncbi:hypothetical protein [Aestuariivirga sp.]